MYEKYYQEYCNEVHKTLGSYLFWRMIHNRAASEEKEKGTEKGTRKGDRLVFLKTLAVKLKNDWQKTSLSLFPVPEKMKRKRGQAGFLRTLVR